MILILCRDLLFASKITSTAEAVGVPVKLIRDTAKLAEENGDRLMVDLTQEGFIDAAADWKRRTGGQVTGFAGHADVETISKAEAAGLDHVMAKGAFVAQLPRLLA